MYINYEQRAVLYLDILGFRALVEGGKEDVLLSALQIPTELQSSYPFNGQTQMQISTFSDTVVVSEILSDGFGMVRLLNYASYLWWKFLAQGVLTRGGLAIGSLIHQNGILLGPAMIEAYDLESQIAVYPRIVVSKNACEMFIKGLQNQHKEAPQMIGFGMRALRKDFDGIFHINTIGSIAPLPQEIFGLPTLAPGESRAMSEADIMRAKIVHVNNVLNNRPSDSLKVGIKYDWLARYFGDEVQGYS